METVIKSSNMALASGNGRPVDKEKESNNSNNNNTAEAASPTDRPSSHERKGVSLSLTSMR
jgi:hypothetical protein